MKLRSVIKASELPVRNMPPPFSTDSLFIISRLNKNGEDSSITMPPPISDLLFSISRFWNTASDCLQYMPPPKKLDEDDPLLYISMFCSVIVAFSR